MVVVDDDADGIDHVNRQCNGDDCDDDDDDAHLDCKMI